MILDAKEPIQFQMANIMRILSTHMVIVVDYIHIKLIAIKKLHGNNNKKIKRKIE